MKNLQAEMKRYGVSVHNIGTIIECVDRTVRQKLNGKVSFTFPEARKIRDTFFVGHSLEYLFADDDSKSNEDPTNQTTAS